MSQHTIPVPPNFPVNWEHPTDERLFWKLARSAFPDPMPPLGFDLIGKFPYGDGLNAAFIEYQVPMNFRSCCFNGYVYETVVPRHVTPDSLTEGEARLQQTIEELPEQWETIWLPEIQQHLSYWEDYDLNNAALPELVTHLDGTIDRIRRMWELHFCVLIPVLVVLSQFEEMCDDLFRENAQIAPYQMLIGSEPYSIKVNQELWQLSRQALNESAVHQMLVQTPTAKVMTVLKALPVAQPFLEGFKDYLDRYGMQGKGMHYIHYPTWSENPSEIIDILKNYLAQPDKDVIAESRRVRTQQEEAVATARSHLKMYPQPVVDQFESLLSIARVAEFLLEDHTFWIDVPVTYHARQIALAIGQRLQAAEVLTQPDDVFYLTYQELKTLAGISPPPPQHTLVNERRETLTKFANVTPPAALGTPPNGPLPSHPALQGVLKVHGMPQPSEETGSLSGYAGSPGIVRGQVKILHSLEEARRLVTGDILVTRTTSIPWVPLFATIAGVVTDEGGILCHSAVVAREMGIPAVVGTGRATTLLKDGQMVEVNGNTGEVRYQGITL